MSSAVIIDASLQAVHANNDMWSCGVASEPGLNRSGQVSTGVLMHERVHATRELMQLLEHGEWTVLSPTNQYHESVSILKQINLLLE